LSAANPAGIWSIKYGRKYIELNNPAVPYCILNSSWMGAPTLLWILYVET
jgi:hypothetical protein